MCESSWPNQTTPSLSDTELKIMHVSNTELRITELQGQKSLTDGQGINTTNKLHGKKPSKEVECAMAKYRAP